MVISGSQWLPVILSGSQWLPVVLNGSQWFSMVTCGSLIVPEVGFESPCYFQKRLTFLYPSRIV